MLILGQHERQEEGALCAILTVSEGEVICKSKNNLSSLTPWTLYRPSLSARGISVVSLSVNSPALSEAAGLPCDVEQPALHAVNCQR